MALTQVKSDGIATGAVTATQIATGAVTANDLEDSGVTAGTYGSSSAIPAITVDAKGRITSASTNAINIDSTAITNGTSNVSVAASGDITATRAGTTRLTVTSGGINVTGQMVSDGIVSDGGVTFTNSAGPQLVLKDNDNTGAGAQSTLDFHDSANGSLATIGFPYNNNVDLEIKNRMNGPIWFGANNTNRVYLDSTGHFIPGVNNAYDLGTSSLRWRNLYTNDLNLSNEGGANDVDGTWGSWTIQEGEEDLFLLNRRNGKKYKFNLTEVN